MMSKYRSAICILGKYMRNNTLVMTGHINYQTDKPQPVRYIAKHWNPKFKKERARKVFKINLSPEALSPKVSSEIDIFQQLKKQGYQAVMQEPEMSMTFLTMGNIIEPYEPPGGDGKYSNVSAKSALYNAVDVNHKRKNFMAMRRLKTYIPDFHMGSFADEAINIYIKAHEALAKHDYLTLSEYVTEFAFINMTEGLLNKTIVWKFLEVLETPKAVQTRVGSLLGDIDNFCQITLRLHTQQILCIYDRFGRRIQGSEILKKDVMEYVVFERHLSNRNGAWRILAKIFPKNYVPQDKCKLTYVIPKEENKTAAAAESV